MPTYCYHCSSCDQIFDIQHKMTEASPTSGPACSRKDCKLSKQMVPVAAMIKSPNPYAGHSGLDSHGISATYSTDKTPEKEHQCGTGCAMHKI
jgi:putative FmdB family regulatory protein